MTVICIQCSLKAILDDAPLPTFEETYAEHMLRCHPNPDKARAERWEIERGLARKKHAP